MTTLPTGTVTFLRTDVEGSMGHVRALGRDWDGVNAEHLAIIRRAVDAHGGTVVRTEGDAAFAAFPEATAAVDAAIDAQRALHGRDWPVPDGLRVRIGLHSGEAHLAGDDYGGFEVNRAARVASAGHGGQIVLSGTTYALVADALPDGIAARDLGEHSLKDVPRPERLYQVEAPGLPSAFPPLRTGRGNHGNLPVRLTSFVGRAAELAELDGLLGTTRLLTLTGPGGIGKTSLAIEVARAHAGRYADGTWLVALDGITDPRLVTAAIARTIGLFDGPARSGADRLHAYLADRSMLLVLDNFEQVLDAAVDVAALLARSPGSRVVVTSRAPLRIGGEQEFQVRPLHDTEDAGLLLFIDRARAVRPGWEPGDEAATVRDICQALDGLPLGIELAAARLALLPARTIRDRLVARLPLPGSGPRDAPARQRTLEGAIRWSHDLLAPDDRALLERLSVFEGSFDAEQAAAVCGPDGTTGEDILGGLMSLTEQSLVIPAPDPRAEPMLGNAMGVRWRLLRTIQAFGLGELERQGRAAEVRARHARAYLALAEAAAPHLPGPDQPRWLDRLGLDQANLRSAVQWAIDAGDAELALSLVAALWRFWQMDGHLHDGRLLTDAALAMPMDGVPPAIRLAAVAAGGNVAYWQADGPAALRRYSEQVALAEALDDPVAEADAYFNLGHVAFVEDGDPGRIATFLEGAHARYEALGDERGMARVRWGRGTMALGTGDLDLGESLLASTLERFEALGDTQYEAMARSSLGWVAFMRGDLATAAHRSIEGVTAAYAQRDLAGTTLTLQEGVVIAAATGRFEEAAVLRGAFEAACERLGVRPPASLRRFLGSHGHLGDFVVGDVPAPWSDAVERGRRLTLDEAVAMMVEIGERVGGSVES
jgi:predicted ATPase/class 3 adenylate cyclase